MKMFISVQMDRPITPQHYITPGGFNFTINGKDIEFDFCESTRKKLFPLEDSGERSCIYCAELCTLDTTSFENSSVLYEKDALSHIERINELFIYTGEPGEDPIINVSKVLEVAFEYDGKTYSVPSEIIAEYNDTQNCAHCTHKGLF